MQPRDSPDGVEFWLGGEDREEGIGRGLKGVVGDGDGGGGRREQWGGSHGLSVRKHRPDEWKEGT